MGFTLKSWRLFWTLAFVITALNGVALSFADLRTAGGTEWLILHAVEFALPFLVLAFTASSLAALWKAPGTRWLLANRRYIGLAFAYGMAWHFAYVAHYKVAFGILPGPLDLVLDVVGLVFLLAMTLTSFHPIRRRMRTANWRRLHTTGIYTLWFLPTYFYLDDFHRDHSVFNLVTCIVLLAALAVRGLARVPARRSWRNYQTTS